MKHLSTSTAKGGIAIAALYQLERWTLRSDLDGIREAHAGLADEWWIRQGEDVEGGKRFEDIVTLLLSGVSPIHVLHESKATEEPAHWIAISHTSTWTDRTKAIWWTIGFWALAALVGYMVVSVLLPSSARVIGESIYGLAVAIAAVRKLLHLKRDSELEKIAHEEAAYASKAVTA